jgi:tellurite resistance protein
MARELAGFFEAFGSDVFDALVETMVLAAEADGELSSDEESAFVRELAALAVAKGHPADVTESGLSGRLAAARASLAREGRDARVAAVARVLRTSEARLGALALAVRVVAADGIVRTSEREVLLELAEGFGIEPEDAANLVIEFAARSRG